jgi:hypothetical protein
MTRWTVPTTLLFLSFALLLAGCTDTHRPAFQESEGPVSQDSHPNTGPADFAPDNAAVQPADLNSPRVDLGTMHLTAPAGWVRKQPQIGFILAEFTLPGAGGAADGRLTVTTAGGSIEANVLRWRGQFGDKPDKESREDVEIAGVKVILVDYSGAYSGQAMAFGSPEQQEGFRMIGAIIPLEGRLYFVKAYGPEKTMAAHAEEVRAMVRSLQSSGPAK